MSEKAEQIKMLLQEQKKIYISVSMKLALGKYENFEINIGKTVNEGIEYEKIFDEINTQIEKEAEKLKEIYSKIANKTPAVEAKTKSKQATFIPATEKQKNLIKRYRKDVDVDKLSKSQAGKIIGEIFAGKEG